MRLTGCFAALLSTLTIASLARADSNYRTPPRAPDTSGPGYYVYNENWLLYGPNYNLRPCWDPFNGARPCPSPTGPALAPQGPPQSPVQIGPSGVPEWRGKIGPDFTNWITQNAMNFPGWQGQGMNFPPWPAWQGQGPNFPQWQGQGMQFPPWQGQGMQFPPWQGQGPGAPCWQGNNPYNWAAAGGLGCPPGSNMAGWNGGWSPPGVYPPCGPGMPQVPCGPQVPQPPGPPECPGVPEVPTYCANIPQVPNWGPLNVCMPDVPCCPGITILDPCCAQGVCCQPCPPPGVCQQCGGARPACGQYPQQGCQQPGGLSFPTNPYCRSPRDFFMSGSPGNKCNPTVCSPPFTAPPTCGSQQYPQGCGQSPTGTQPRSPSAPGTTPGTMPGSRTGVPPTGAGMTGITALPPGGVSPFPTGLPPAVSPFPSMPPADGR